MTGGAPVSGEDERDGDNHRGTLIARAALPSGWESSGDDYEYAPLRLPPDVTRVTASMRLAIQAEFSGWELSRVRLYTDGSRRVLLRRRKTTLSAAAGPNL